MPAILLFLFGGLAKDILAVSLFVRRRQNRLADQVCRRWPHRQQIPIVNWYLKYKAGKPADRVERVRNTAIVTAVRTFVNTETFEHVVSAYLNKRSTLRKWKLPKIFQGTKPPKKHWGTVDIIG